MQKIVSKDCGTAMERMQVRGRDKIVGRGLDCKIRQDQVL